MDHVIWELFLVFLAGMLLGLGILFFLSRQNLRRQQDEAAAVQARQEQVISELRAHIQAQQSELLKQNENRVRAETENQQIPLLNEALKTAQDEINQLHNNLNQIRGQQAELQERLEQERLRSNEKLTLLEEARQRLTETFQSLSADALRRNNQSFLDLARENLERFQENAKTDWDGRQKAVGQLIEPIRESMEKVGQRMDAMEKTRIDAYGALNEQLRGLVQDHLPRLHQETAALVKALRQPAARGRWGEMQLKRVVEMAGMLAYCDFAEQESVQTETGQQRPDLVVRLPGGKRLIVDAKAPLN
ncbi:MAG: DNA recombination protein RmuC, partial [Sideroxydans sp.]|nr:DNA recombination protein RmuC [Sideroxydans sp.]